MSFEKVTLKSPHPPIQIQKGSKVEGLLVRGCIQQVCDLRLWNLESKSYPLPCIPETLCHLLAQGSQVGTLQFQLRKARVGFHSRHLYSFHCVSRHCYLLKFESPRWATGKLLGLIGPMAFQDSVLLVRKSFDSTEFLNADRWGGWEVIWNRERQ